jgi:hypothetical protein
VEMIWTEAVDTSPEECFFCGGFAWKWGVALK